MKRQVHIEETFAFRLILAKIKEADPFIGKGHEAFAADIFLALERANCLRPSVAYSMDDLEEGGKRDVE